MRTQLYVVHAIARPGSLKSGGGKVSQGPYAGDGKHSPVKSEFIAGFELSEAEKADVLAFLRSLTDEEFIRDDRLKDPWSTPHR